MKNPTHSIRRYAVFHTPYSTNIFYPRNPWIVSWWSAAFPGFGHYMLGKYFSGFLLMVWEVLINSLAHLNHAIYFSMIGQAEAAKEVLNEEWMVVYITVYVFQIWDSHRRAVEYNHYFTLAYSEGLQMKLHYLSGLEINILEKRKPHLAMFWSVLTPGLGHFYVNRVLAIFFNLGVWVFISYFAGFYRALVNTILGKFAVIPTVVNPQWFLFIPSLYIFITYDSYKTCKECNKLFDYEQAKFLQKEYQSDSFKMPI
ncbi:hypothetical protein [Metabacillus arenae]|uniref:Uncharacterized protein n=1 Tax=Metabacillus arenae TaxID=2771434 RepID=A0A926S0V1_9BACI|nr:hypothetical protein [Metabacillus arenae]MBD1380389.1 hypothetical protein [Metabacillus arenae]